ncbi:hypothetical protein TUMSATVNIG1_57370 (plasmid) [Vibrio nigripulchritudo]|uniref:basic secretory protein-like protein n=1 Tax=Vibrio nigripulchritudo TaxID=28173 RepID=UPI00190CC03A|nr:basic secretory protein-like protein [Vibrio nigripulchritudo]BCL73752.1 hypothetical protein VNTUMSATTG_56890 [Vibrio nigripulchritudo]BDU35128.1 hypothetical protein TUMSATVNIG1_57370 [Vibrio nigripulchritudo]
MTRNFIYLNKIVIALFFGLSSSAYATVNSDLTQDIIPNITSSSDNPPYETDEKTFDDKPHTKWLTFNPTGWISYNFNKKAIITGYSITSANDEPTRDPKNWILQGSNNGQDWHNLDSREEQQFSTRKEKKSYHFKNTNPYKIIRFKIQSNHGANLLQLAELEYFGMFEDSNKTPPKLPVNESFSLSSGKWKHYGPFNTEGDIIAETTGQGDIDLYINSGAPASPSNYICKSVSPDANESCKTSGNDLYVSVESQSDSQVTLKILADNTTPPKPDKGLWKKPIVDFVDMDPQTSGSQLFKIIIQDPSGHMAQRCVDVAKVLYKDPAESKRFKKLRFELREKDFAGKDFVAYKVGGLKGEMTIAVSTSHLEKLYQAGGHSYSAISDEINGILFHEATHGYNNSPITRDSYLEGKENWAYTEGLADAVRIGAGFHKTREPNINNAKKWLGGYETTGFFLHYVQTKLDDQFLYKLNQSAKEMRDYTWSFDVAFRKILGRGVEDVWDEYVDFIKNGGKLEY